MASASGTGKTRTLQGLGEHVPLEDALGARGTRTILTGVIRGIFGTGRRRTDADPNGTLSARG
ncbi:hypothetical protein [Microbacterium sp.]|uniref:hypothetical protein n=1 Tax=Microbacterium sp. TaxID=51671 RepID=UPI0025F6B503|nr:hypothetical protein [Microbacterium sp.]